MNKEQRSEKLQKLITETDEMVEFLTENEGVLWSKNTKHHLTIAFFELRKAKEQNERELHLPPQPEKES